MHTHTHTQLCFVILKTEALYEVIVLNIRERVATKAHTHTQKKKKKKSKRRMSHVGSQVPQPSL